MAAVLIGNDAASKAYVGHKVKACENVGFKGTIVSRGADISEYELLRIVNGLNNDSQIDGFYSTTSPTPHINSQVIEAVSPIKDVDGFIQNEKKDGFGLKDI